MGRRRILQPQQVIRRGSSNVPFTHEPDPRIFTEQDHPSGLDDLPKPPSEGETPDEQQTRICIGEENALDEIAKAFGGIAAKGRPPES